MESFSLSPVDFQKVTLLIFGEGKKCPEVWKAPIGIEEAPNGNKILFKTEEKTSGIVSILQSYSIIARRHEPKLEGKMLLAKSILMIMKKIRGDNYIFCEKAEEFSSASFKATNLSAAAEEYLINSDFLDSEVLLFNLLVSFTVLAGPAMLNSPKKKMPFISFQGFPSLNFLMLLLTGFPADTTASQYSIEDGSMRIPVSTSQQIGIVGADPGSLQAHVGGPLSKPKERIWVAIYIGRATAVVFEDGCFIEYNPCATGELRIQSLESDSSLFTKLQSLVQ
jgi:hypothetical protein